MSHAILADIDSFPIGLRDLVIFVALSASSVFILVSAVALRLPLLRSVRRLWIWSAACVISAITGYLIAHEVVAMNSAAPINSIELAALGVGLMVAAAVAVTIFVMPIKPVVRPAFFRSGIALVAAAAVFAASSLIAHEIIIDESAQSLPQAVIQVLAEANNGAKPFYVRIGPTHPLRFTVGEPELLSVDVVGSLVKPMSIDPVTGKAKDIDQLATIPPCRDQLFVRFEATGADVRVGNEDPSIPKPFYHGVWQWIVTPRDDGRQLLYLRVDAKPTTTATPQCLNEARRIVYDEAAYVHIKPSFLTDAAVSQWIALVATIAGIASAVFGIVRGKD